MASPTTDATASGQRPRCPRCGSAMGALASESRDVPSSPSAARDLYCGCCGLVLSAPVAPAG